MPKHHKQTKHVSVSDYSNFKGKKKQAWYAYFTESQACLSNSNNMPIFVVCAKVRKQHLKQFIFCRTDFSREAPHKPKPNQPENLVLR
jgi:hypothetical protein